MKEATLSHSMTHYLLVIHKLKEKKGYARITDISKELNITKGSVSTAVNNLKKKKLIVEEDDSKFLLLSDKGHQEVHNILSNRTLLFYFFKDVLGVDEKKAEQGACDMEHLVSQEIRSEFFSFMKTISLPYNNTKKKTLLESLKNFETALDLSQFKNLDEFIEQQPSEYNLEENSEHKRVD